MGYHEEIDDDVVRLERELAETKDKLLAAIGGLRMIRDAKVPAGTVYPSEWFEGYARQVSLQVLGGLSYEIRNLVPEVQEARSRSDR